MSPAHSNPNNQQARAADLSARSQQIGEDIEALFGPGSERVAAYEAVAASFRQEWSDLAANRGIDLPAFLFVGPREAGKTTLVNLLTGSDACHDPSDRRIRWIGPVAPCRLDPQWEECRIVAAEDMPAIGCSCLLVDAPGSLGDEDRDALFHRVLAASRFKVLVLRHSQVEAEAWQLVAADFTGSVVLPVIRLDANLTVGLPDNLGELEQRWQNDYLPEIQRKLAGVTLEEPLFIGDFNAEGGWDKHAAAIRVAMVSGLRRLVEKYAADGQNRRAELEASWIRFLNAMRPIISGFGGHLAAQRSRELDHALAGLPREIVDSLLADERQLKAWFRLEASKDLMACISMLAFPFRPLASLLCFTTGAWDRLILASIGSVPSVLLTTASTLRRQYENLKTESNHLRTPDHFKSLIRRRLAEPWRSFMAAMSKAGADVSPQNDPVDGIRMSGEEELAVVWTNAKEEAVTVVTRRFAKTIAWLAATLGTMVFWVLFGGPLVHVYGLYFPASIHSLSGSWTTENLATYPAMTASFWLTAVVLSIIPCFVIALMLVAWWLRDGRILGCIAHLRMAMGDHLASQNAGLRIEATHPQVAAYRRLSHLIGEERSTSFDI